jgi:hypothetical protein
MVSSFDHVDLYVLVISQENRQNPPKYPEISNLNMKCHLFQITISCTVVVVL